MFFSLLFGKNSWKLARLNSRHWGFEMTVGVVEREGVGVTIEARRTVQCPFYALGHFILKSGFR